MTLLERDRRNIEQGIEQGIERKALEDAINLKKAGIDCKIIAKCVGLPLEVVEELSWEN